MVHRVQDRYIRIFVVAEQGAALEGGPCAAAWILAWRLIAQWPSTVPSKMMKMYVMMTDEWCSSAMIAHLMLQLGCAIYGYQSNHLYWYVNAKLVESRTTYFRNNELQLAFSFLKLVRYTGITNHSLNYEFAWGFIWFWPVCWLYRKFGLNGVRYTGFECIWFINRPESPTRILSCVFQHNMRIHAVFSRCHVSSLKMGDSLHYKWREYIPSCGMRASFAWDMQKTCMGHTSILNITCLIF